MGALSIKTIHSNCISPFLQIDEQQTTVFTTEEISWLLRHCCYCFDWTKCTHNCSRNTCCGSGLCWSCIQSYVFVSSYSWVHVEPAWPESTSCAMSVSLDGAAHSLLNGTSVPDSTHCPMLFPVKSCVSKSPSRPFLHGHTCMQHTTWRDNYNI